MICWSTKPWPATASKALRHADINVTDDYYTDSRVRVTPGTMLVSNPPGNGRSSLSRVPKELPFLNSALRRLTLGNWTWLLVFLLTCRVTLAEPVAVRHREGTLHGFLLVRTLEGTAIA